MGHGLAQSQRAIDLLAIGDRLNHAGYYDSAASVLLKGRDIVQEEDTSTFIEICYALGESYLNQGKCDSALYFANLGLELGRQTDDKIAAGYSKLARAQGGCSGDWAQAIVTLKKALQMLERSAGDEAQLIVSYNLMGYLYLHHGKYDSAQFFLDESLSIQSQMEDDKVDAVELSTTYYYLSKVLERKVDLKKALDYGHQALAIRKDQLRPYHPSISNATNDIGNIYKRLGNYDRALDYFLKGLEIRKQTLGEDHVNVGASYYSIGTLYGNMFNYNKAIHFIEQGNLIVEKRFGEGLPVLFTYYAFLGQLYHKVGEAKQAEAMFSRSEKLAEEHLSDNHLYRAFIYNALGQYYAELGSFDRQRTYHQKALDIYESKGSSSVSQADVLVRLGSVETSLNNFSQAERYLEEALEIYLDRVGVKNPKVATVYQLFGDLSQKQDQYLQALDFYWKSLNAVSFDQIKQDSSFSLHSFTHKQMAMKSLHEMANTYKSFYEDGSDDINRLKEAYKYYMLAHDLIDLIGSEYQLENSRVQLAEDTRKAFDDAMEAVYMLYEQSDDDTYKEALFSIIEKSKSPVLLARIQEKEARKYGNVPDSLMAVEQDLRVELTYYKEGLRNSSASGDTAKMDFYQKEIFRTRNAYNDFKAYLQNNFPTYYSYWYSNDLIKLSNVQKELAENMQLMEYYEGEDHFYLASIRRDGFEVHRIEKEDGFDTSLENYLRSLTDNVFIVDNPRKADSLYVESASYLNQQLIQPFLDNRQEIDQLIIVPDGRLNTINFGTFLTQPVSIQTLDRVDYKQLSYLLSKYAISYAYSSTLNFRTKSDNGRSQFAGFAPSYESASYNNMDSTSHPMAYELVRNGRLALPGAIDEIKQINQLLNGDIWIDEDASESNFKANASKYGILHLAMHSLINTDEPEYSELLFNSTRDSLNDGYLTIDEIYNLDISAGMVVLSACSSGEGTLLTGEGPVSFTRAFSYAGCPSVIMSMWKLPDAATSKIMVDFYENIRVGDPKNLALQKAQLAYLKNTDDPLYQHPFFWGSFVTMGSTRPIVEPGKNLLLYVILSIAGLVFVFVVSRATINRRGN